MGLALLIQLYEGYWCCVVGVVLRSFVEREREEWAQLRHLAGGGGEREEK